MANKIFKCPYCELKFVQKSSLYSHMENKHEEQLNGLTPAHAYFNFVNKKDHGNCVICHKETKFNEETERYERLCGNPKCKEAYVKMFRERMQKKYGKTTLLNDPEQQKKMLKNRKISGVYVWSTNPKYKFDYTGTYEKDFLEFLDIFLHWNPADIVMPAPMTFKYKYENKEHFYIPDVYLINLNLIIEIKSYENKHYRERDIGIEKAKDKLMYSLSKEINYIKIHDKDYDDFYLYLLKRREEG